MAKTNYIRSRNGAKGAKVPPPGKVNHYWMRDRPGLCLKVTPTGQKLWFFQYREIAPETPYAERKTRKLRLPPECRYFVDSDAHWDEVREVAAQWRRWLEQGHDPQQLHAAAVAESLPATAASGAPPEQRPERSFAELTKIYIRLRREGLTSKSWKRYERLAKQRIYDRALGEMPMSEVSVLDLAGAVEAEHRHSSDGSRTLATLISNIMLFAFRRGLTTITVESKALTPEDRDKRTKKAKLRALENEEGGARHLEDWEVKAIWDCDAVYPAKPWFQMMILTGMRREECARIEWSDISDGYINMPAEKTKAARAYSIPITPQIEKVLDDMGYNVPMLRAGDWLFSSPKNPSKPINGFSYWTEKVLKAAGLEGVSPHSCRKTSTTGMQRLGIDENISERAHNRAGTKLAKQIAKAYHRYDFREEIDAAFEKWNWRVAKIVTGEEKVIEMKRGAAA